ncbi:hypothetical protein FO519_004394 [Halicephalobus sp. NKZ332]|nr:hypothetical protein FO519_004394 [Halicephalobus sp. NKZ332]
MIHPINLPEELLAANPTRPSLIELRRKPRITYTPDGRKMKDGIPTTPKSPSNLWESVFVRGFVHRMACNAKIEAEETSSVDSLIDIVDLHLPSEVPLSTSDLASATDRPELSPEDSVEPKFAFSTRAVEELYESEDSGICRRSSGQFTKSSPSVIVDPDVIDPILKPCCSSSELRCDDKCLYTRRFPNLKEFLRFDFSHSKDLFGSEESESTNESRSKPGSQLESGHDCEPKFELRYQPKCGAKYRAKYKSKSRSKSEDEEPRKSSITLIPYHLGSRIWVKKPLSKSYSHGQGRSVPKKEILFNVENVKVTQEKFNLETIVHLHIAKNQDIKDLLFSKEVTFEINPSHVNVLNINVDLNSVDLSKVFIEEDQYVVVTVLGHVDPHII